jgi:hypothetical protein
MKTISFTVSDTPTESLLIKATQLRNGKILFADLTNRVAKVTLLTCDLDARDVSAFIRADCTEAPFTKQEIKKANILLGEKSWHE